MHPSSPQLARQIALWLDHFTHAANPRDLTPSEWSILGDASTVLHRFHDAAHGVPTGPPIN